MKKISAPQLKIGSFGTINYTLVIRSKDDNEIIYEGYSQDFVERAKNKETAIEFISNIINNKPQKYIAEYRMEDTENEFGPLDLIITFELGPVMEELTNKYASESDGGREKVLKEYNDAFLARYEEWMKVLKDGE